jgi:hypothetical protein
MSFVETARRVTESTIGLLAFRRQQNCEKNDVKPTGEHAFGTRFCTRFEELSDQSSA